MDGLLADNSNAFLDNPVVQVLLSGSPYMQSREREAVANRQGQAYNNLLDSYRVPGDPTASFESTGLQSPLMSDVQQLQQRAVGGYKGPGGGLLSAGPPTDFYVRAAGIPGYQQLAGVAQTQQGAMDRQMQAQNWESQNMTLAQKATNDLNIQKQQWEQERRDFEYKNLSAAQKQSAAQGWAHVGIAQQGQGLNERKFAWDQAKANLPLAAQLPPQQRMEFVNNLSNLDQTAAIIQDTTDYLSKIGVGGKVMDRGEVNNMAAEYRTRVVPYFQNKFEAGALQKGDMEFIESVAGNPGGWATMDSRQQQRLASLLQSVNDDRKQQYQMAGVQAPPVAPGTSAWARSRSRAGSSGKVPDDIVWGP